MNILLFCEVEEVLQRRKKQHTCDWGQDETTQKVSLEIARSVEDRRKKAEQEETLDEVIIRHIRRLNNRNFYRKNGELKESAFYKYAYIDKSTWSELRRKKIVPKKKTLLKLVIALRLNEEDAIDLLRRGSSSFDPRDMRDQIILALIELKCYNPDDVYEVLEEYRLHGPQPFENIYDINNLE